MDKKKKNKKEPMNNKKKAMVAGGVVVGVVLVVVLIGVLLFYRYYGMMGGLDDIPSESVDVSDELDATGEPMSSQDVSDLENNMQQNQAGISDLPTDAFNILLIGVDSRSDSYSGRSDSMILVSINTTTKKILMTSFLRDMYVTIPGYTSNRLNAAYAYGGTDLLKQTIKTNFGISVDRCVVGNFYTVMDIVDELGGLDIKVSSAEIKYMNGYIKNHNYLLGNDMSKDLLSESSAGVLHLNGSQALAYARVRYVGTDFGRTERQRTVVSLCAEKLKTKSLTELNTLLEKFLPKVRTDLSAGECASLITVAMDLSNYQVESMAIPQSGTWQNANIRGMSVLTVDFAANAQAWYNAVNG